MGTHRAESLTIRAPAKLNLFLEVLGRRADGFHEVETSMVAVSWFDTLTFTEDVTETEEVVRLHCVNAASSGSHGSEPEIPTGADNLVVRAARLLRDRVGTTQGARIGLVKRIPAEAGLGGGSSDAAATLVGLNRLWRLGLPRTELAELAAELGSDVPFFLFPERAAICRGRGELIEPIRPTRTLHFVVAKPPFGCATGAVYSAVRLPDRPEPIDRHLHALHHQRPVDVARTLHNRLRPAAETTHEQLEQIADVFSKLDLLGHSMSGSGSAWFGLCRSARHARAVAARLSATGTGRVVACRSL